MLIDTHCHLDFPEFDPDRAEVLKRAKEQGIDYVINIGSSLKGSIDSVKLAHDHPNIFAVVGCHPHDSKDFSPQDIDRIRSLAASDKVVAIGEIGLDYFRSLSPHDAQEHLFRSLLGVAKDLQLPAVIHSRDAGPQTLRILKEEKVSRAIVHCFSGDESFLRACLDAGLYVSFTCNVTYKKAAALRELVKQTPLDRMCLETDAPYLSPEGYRGKRNEPGFVRLLAEEIARIKDTAIEEIAIRTTQNADTFFKLAVQSV